VEVEGEKPGDGLWPCGYCRGEADVGEEAAAAAAEAYQKKKETNIEEEKKQMQRRSRCGREKKQQGLTRLAVATRCLLLPGEIPFRNLCPRQSRWC
jgi:hypothetical protein